jgi:UDP-glucose 4-epimerase
MLHSRQGIINWFVRQAMDGQTIELYGGGKQIRDATYIDDVVSALLMTGAEKMTIGSSYNIGGSAAPLFEIAALIVQLTKSGTVVRVPFPKEYIPIEVGDYVADFTAFSRATGWKPTVDFETGLRATIEYYKKHREFYWEL